MASVEDENSSGTSAVPRTPLRPVRLAHYSVLASECGQNFNDAFCGSCLAPGSLQVIAVLVVGCGGTSEKTSSHGDHCFCGFPTRGRWSLSTGQPQSKLQHNSNPLFPAPPLCHHEDCGDPHHYGDVTSPGRNRGNEAKMQRMRHSKRRSRHRITSACVTVDVTGLQ
ncbi:hypothetical protein IscW_ISCW018205 [Ixodes scapularis]|uniref:Uncharacterized protein n=1 Tax=Ixodes scapularis TaxID=6945 RepID=B7PE11_IXOSC|nr:hypothetical protein IscW_ISCW018205 [Ixodes scapularis]|eukprot:XP_002399589.1 hypothetical protein IscW_ISCW018205 [Ixodes scapularis]